MDFFNFLGQDAIWFSYDVNLIRRLELLLQLPVVLFGQLTSFTVPVLAKIYSLTICLHPAISLLFCWLILAKRQREYFFIFPLLSISVCTQILMAYSYIGIPLTMSFYWPLLLLLLFGNRRSMFEFLMSLLLSFGLFFGYEAAVLLFLLNIYILICSVRSSKTKPWRDLLLLLVNCVGLLFVAWRILGPYGNHKESFLRSLFSDPPTEPFRLFQMAAIFLMVAWTGALLICKDRLQAKIYGFVIAASLGLPVLFFALLQMEGVRGVYNTVWYIRTTALPFAGLVCLLAIVVAQFEASKPNWWHGPAYHSLLVLTFVCVSIGIWQDFALTRLWNQGYVAMKNFGEKYPGCNIVSKRVYEKLFYQKYAFGDWWLPYLSLDIAKSATVTSVILIQNDVNENSCVPRDGKLWLEKPAGFDIPIEGYRRFDLSRLVAGPIFLHSWDDTQEKLITREVSR
jgi:hypothetical protein